MAVGTAVSLLSAAAGAYSGIKGAKQQGGGGGTPAWQQRNQQDIYKDASGYNREIAGFSGDQVNAFEGVRNQQGRYADQWGNAMDTANLLQQGVSPEDIARFRNPYEEDVVGSYINDMDRYRGKADAAAQSDINAGRAFGNNRGEVYRANLEGERDANNARTLGDLRYRGHELATNSAFRNHGQRLAGNQNLQNLLIARQNSDYNDLNALATSGGMQQQYEQMVNDAPMDTMRFRSEMNNPASYSNPGQSGPPVDKFAAGISGFQGGFNTGSKAWDWGKQQGWWG